MTIENELTALTAGDSAVNYDQGNVLMGQRKIPMPTHISAEAQMSMKCAQIMPSAKPALGDVKGWEEHIKEVNINMAPFIDLILNDDSLLEHGANPMDRVETKEVSGVTVYVARPENISAERDKYAYLIIHGGAMVYGEGLFAQAVALSGMREANCSTYSVDYRVPPHFPYPAALEDTVAVYQALLADYAPENIIISGASGGANIAAAAVLKVRDMGLPMPAAVVLLTPELDLTESGDSFQTNRFIDYVLQDTLMPLNELYAGGHDMKDPYLSPLFGDFTKGYPPTFLQTGTRDLFLSNAVRMHRALLNADIPAELHVGEALPHAFFTGSAPEDKEMSMRTRRFINGFFKED